jgi:hypothetical protein
VPGIREKTCGVPQGTAQEFPQDDAPRGSRDYITATKPGAGNKKLIILGKQRTYAAIRPFSGNTKM